LYVCPSEGPATSDTLGEVLSTFTETVDDALFPARSAQVALTAIAPPSPDDVREFVHWTASTPETASPQFQVTATSLLFQPAAFGSGSCVIADGAGAVLSTRTE